MSVANKGLSKWQKIAGIGMACSLVLAGCDRSDKEDTTETAELTEQDSDAIENAAATAVSCDDPMVQDRLKATLKTHSLSKRKLWLLTMPTMRRLILPVVPLLIKSTVS